MLDKLFKVLEIFEFMYFKIYEMYFITISYKKTNCNIGVTQKIFLSNLEVTLKIKISITLKTKYQTFIM